jgi:hypothetical protein
VKLCPVSTSVTFLRAPPRPEVSRKGLYSPTTRSPAFTAFLHHPPPRSRVPGGHLHRPILLFRLLAVDDPLKAGDVRIDPAAQHDSRWSWSSRDQTWSWSGARPQTRSQTPAHQGAGPGSIVSSNLLQLRSNLLLRQPSLLPRGTRV